ncbi:50S ribosomal protein L22 [Verrucomicrobiaceae bacterium R5-34]|nr:50S ribosomal protein L22 [Verrucomicrobiaceae bacterium R5-34]
MEVKSTYKYARISPKKARDVARAIQGMPVSDALDALAYTPRKAAALIGKTLKSAVANAENNYELIADDLTVKEATVGDGPTFKRFKPRARGSAGAIRKRTSHLYIILTDEEEIPEPRERSSKPKKRSVVAKPKANKEAAPKKEAAPVEAEEAKAEDAAE